MNELQQTTSFLTPIEVELGVDENGMTTARKLYSFLELRKADFARWAKTNITENEFASHIYRIDKVKQMIERQKEKYGWEFLFLGANIDAIETASHFGIDADKAANYQCDCEGTALNYEVLNDAISAVRCNAALDSSWKKRIDKDYQKRGQHTRA